MLGRKWIIFSLILCSFFASVVVSTFPNVPQCNESDANRLHCIFVDPKNGLDNSSCLTSGSPNISCNSLDWVFNVTYRSNQTVYVLSNGTHKISSPVAIFQNLNNISFFGKASRDTVIQCTAENIGLSFERVTELSFSQISFVNCSALRNSTSKSYSENGKLKFMEILVALHFIFCKNIAMDCISVNHSPSATGVVVYNTIGINKMTNSEFSYNQVSNDMNGGGGFYVEFTFCIPGDENCSDSVDSYTNENHDSVYLFESCLFRNNVGYVSDLGNTTYLVPYRSNHIAVGRGGGLSFFMKGNANSNSVSISNCWFKQNSATWGGGLFVEFHDDTYNNVVMVQNCTMVNNYCPFTSLNGTAGGGMRLGHYVFGSKSQLNNDSNQITILDSNFLGNAALNGGGLSISPTVQNVDTNHVARVFIYHSNFVENTARLGAAFHLSRFAMILDGAILNVSILDCMFKHNSNDYIKFLHKHKDKPKINAYQLGLGALYVNQVPLKFQVKNTFTNNNGSALVAVGAALDFSNSIANFSLNKGMNGGAIALLGLAWLRINDYTSMEFWGNNASLDGGAIYNKYIERENLISYGNCFIRHSNFTVVPSKWDSTFTFIANFDQGGARISAIYSTSILPCAWSGGSLVSQKLASIFCWSKSWTYFPQETCSANIHSDIGNVTFTDSSKIVNAFPGIQFSVPIHIMDDLQKSLGSQSLFSRSLNGSEFNSSSSVEYIWNLTATIHQNVSSESKLILDSVSDRVWHIVVKVDLNDCPPGLKFDEHTSQCKCVSSAYSGVISCDPDLQKAYLKNGNWMGKMQGHSGYLSSFCPTNYCFSNETKALPYSTEELEADLCRKYHRNGTMCGSCIDGFAVAVNSPYFICINCSFDDLVTNQVKYIASVYIPLALLFSLIIIFKIRLTSAPANAFILFSQVVAGTFSLYADGQIPVSEFAGKNSENFVKAYKTIYGAFNLEFAEQFLSPFCVGDLNALGVLALDYVVAFFPLVMILIILTIYRIERCFSCVCCPTTGRIGQMIKKIHHQRTSISEAIVPAFAAFFLLSYNKFSMTSSLSVSTQHLLTDSGEPANFSDGKRVYYAGFYSFYDPEYRIRYLLPACIVFIIFVAIPPILLLDFPLKILERILIKLPFLWRLYPVDKVHILLDTFQGCYKDKMRFFVGLYFLFRLAVNIAYNGTNSWLAQYLIQQILCSVMVVLLLVCQPYNEKNKIFNIVDPLIFTNLGILNAISFYLLSITKEKLIPDVAIFLVQFILVLLPLVFMISYIVWYFMKPCAKHLAQKLNSTLQSRSRFRYQLLHGIANDTSSQQVDNDRRNSISVATSEDEALLRRAESRNTYQPHTTTVVGLDSAEVSGTIQTTDSRHQSARTSSNNNHGPVLIN